MIKKLGISLLALSMITGCTAKQTEEESSSSTEAVEEEPAVLTYKELSNPTALLSEIYTNLMNAHDNSPRVNEPKYAAAYFAVDFFTWSNKTEREDIGGINMVLPVIREDFASYALRDYYVNFTELYNQYGSSNLPEVTDYDIEEMTDSDFVYNQDGYQDLTYKDITVSLTYKNNYKYDTDELMSEVVVTVVKQDDLWYVVAVNYDQDSYPLVEEETSEETTEETDDQSTETASQEVTDGSVTETSEESSETGSEGTETTTTVTE